MGWVLGPRQCSPTDQTAYLGFEIFFVEQSNGVETKKETSTAKMVATRIENIFVKVTFGWMLLAAMFTSVPLNVNVFVGANSNELGQNGGSTVGEVNISAILNSFQMGYDKRVRPNYGGLYP